MKEGKPDQNLLDLCDTKNMEYKCVFGINWQVYMCQNPSCENAVKVVGNYVCNKVYGIRKENE